MQKLVFLDLNYVSGVLDKFERTASYVLYFIDLNEWFNFFTHWPLGNLNEILDM